MHKEQTKKFLQKYKKAKAERAVFEDLFQECYDYALPQRRGYYFEAPGQRRDERIFDEILYDCSSTINNYILTSYQLLFFTNQKID